MADTNEVVEEITEEVDGELEEEYYEDAEAEAEAEGEGQAQAEMAVGSITEVQDQTFVEIRLPSDLVSETQEAWNAFLNSASSREAAGEAIYAALFDSAPSLQSLFKTPRAVMAMRFMNGLNSIINAMHTPSELKTTVETLGFQHLDLEVTVPRVVIFRDAIVDLFDMEMGARFSSKAKGGMISILNYVGGAYIYVRREYAGRLKIIASSWRVAANKKDDELEVEEGAEEGAEEAEGEADAGKNVEGAAANAEQEKGQNLLMSSDMRASGEGKNSNATKVPTNFNEMFLFNSAVMGFAGSTWMNELLEVFDDIVTNVANSYRLQECCDTLSLSLAKYTGTINLPEYKAVMLAALRSLVPKDWDGAHEVAWTWLWENVERMLKAQMGKPAVLEKALERLILSLTEDSLNYLRREVYQRFFALAPAGQDYFKQSTTRLYWIADRVVEMTIEMYRDPKKMVEDISALGLRHVGYAIPTEFFAPFVSGAVEVIRAMNADETAEEAFRWSLSLVSRILVRTITEGSTIVMKAINTNSAKQLNKAVSCAPRGKRAIWMLNITVGTQSISPFYWAIESGSLETARAMIIDLLIIRADRDNYYYGVDDLFTRHPDVMGRLSADAQTLLPNLLDGLIWRSRVAANGYRRVNYYVKHLVQDQNGGFDPALSHLVANQDPVIICHPVVVIFSDLIWSRLANRYFLMGRMYFLFTLSVFLCSQSILVHVNPGSESQAERIARFALVLTIYIGSLGQLAFSQIKNTCKDLKNGKTTKIGPIPIPSYLTDWKNAVSLVLMLCLILMLANEPILYCIPTMDSSYRRLQSGTTTTTTATTTAKNQGLFNSNCSDGSSHKEVYSTVSMIAMLLYWVLVIDFTVLSTRISSFILVCGKVLSEVCLFLGALFFLVLTFASSISALNHNNDDFSGVPKGILSLMLIALGMFPTSNFETMQDEQVVLMAVTIFIIVALVFLLNLLVAQLNGAYQAIYRDMVGYARLNRGKIICETLLSVSKKRWEQFLLSMKFEDRLEFNEGDVGLAGGIQILEPSNLNPTTIDAIKRFGGSTSPAMQWPEEENGDEEDKFDRLEKVITRATKARTGGKKKGKSGGSSMGGSAAEDKASGGSMNSGGSNVGSE
eukprot:TRINITY_DN20287_c0_g1_i2.p1 TRINITY_DN20287_c0_g1~~TRINITY_DN20287_c0_g1_i2.p1  ORF type:complete len:1122 (-),score=271.21 TRINITY_DN20287_c0_g1_i2:382-3747(-)